MLKRIVMTASVIVALFVYQNASAAPTSFAGIEDYGWFTRDTVQNLDFLDVTTFVNHSYSDLESGIIYNSRHWRLASVYEVTSIWNLAQPNAPDGVGYWAAPNHLDPGAGELVDLFGVTHTSSGARNSNGITATQASLMPEEYYTAVIWDYYVSYAAYTVDQYNTQSSASPGSAYDSRGAWLVAPVPLPGAVWLLGSGLIGLLGLRKKFKS